MRRSAGPLLLALLALTACSGGGKPAGPSDDVAASLEHEILAWRNDLKASNRACVEAPAGKACADFEVACKGALPISPQETAAGVTAKVVAAMTYNGWDAGGEEFKPQSAFALFSRTGQAWTRKPTAPVNLTTCAAA